ncbi:MAG: hypothetical protein DRR19_00155 [Candidatus Parabeggiatoa sp. nov. 1]|nr:MAG: hypothetical protein DRR19_00155 [Gammaproteobacteria bacterium]
MLQVPVNYQKPEETLSESHLVNVRKALQIILENHPDVFVANSPEEALQKLGFHFPEKKQKGEKKPKGKWAAVAEQLSTQHTLSPEAGKILEEEGKKFREGFVLGDYFDNQEK